MKEILFNGLLYSKFGAGISNYAKNLVENMIENNNIDFMLSEDVEDKYKGYNNIKFVNNINNSKDRIIYEQIKALNYYKKYKIIHFPDYATPVLSGKKKVATIHDLAFFSVENCYTSSQVAVKKFLLNRTLKDADKLICISKFTYNELKRYYPDIDDSKIEIIHNGFNKPRVNFSKVDLLKFNLNTEYILFVGTISPSKNLVRLVEAFNEIKNIKKGIKLVIAGKNGWKFNEVYEKVSQLNMSNDIIFTGYVTNDELETLYRSAMFVVYPSLYEGFGLPPLEALSRNKPVLVSNIPVLEEILGDSVFYCNPNIKEDIAKNMQILITNDEYRNSKRNLANKTVNKYSWEACAAKTYNVYEKLMED